MRGEFLQRVHRFIRRGGRGTGEQIAARLQVEENTVRYALKQLEARQLAVRRRSTVCRPAPGPRGTPRRYYAEVWERFNLQLPPQQLRRSLPGGMLARALQSRSALECVWGRVVGSAQDRRH